MKEVRNPFEPFFVEALPNIESYLEKYFVKTDCIKFFEHYFERNLTYVNFVVEGVRGGGKTSCLWYLQNLLSKDEKNLVIYFRVSFYPSPHSYSESSNTDHFLFLLPFYRAVFHFFYRLIPNEIGRRENMINSIFSFKTSQHVAKQKFDHIQNFILNDLFAIFERISADYGRVVFLVDDIDKFPVSSLKGISTAVEKNNIVLSLPESIKVSLVCATNPAISSDVSCLLRRLTQREVVIVDIDWDIGYSTEVVRKRIESIAERRLRDYLDDEALFILHRDADQNPRNILSILGRLWETTPRCKGHILASDLKNLIKEHQGEFLFLREDLGLETEFKLRIKPYFRRILIAKTNQEKGKALETLLCRLFESVKGFSILDTNVRTSSEEIDILVMNEASDPFLRNLGTPILVECKKWHHPVSAKEVNWFVSKVKRRSLKMGILVAWEGITGNDYRDANLEIQRALEEGITIAVVTRDHLMKVFSRRDLVGILKDCYYRAYKL